jgi:hypothetical protein
VEETRARQAYEIMRNAGFPSYAEAVHLVHDGNFVNMPMLTAEDVKRAYELFGEPVGSARGKSTKKRVSHAVHDDVLVMDQRKQVLHMDIMHIEGQ